MLVVLCVLVGVGVVVIGVFHVRLRRRLAGLVALDGERSKEIDRANAELRDASTTAAELKTERDEALERVHRSRRDAAEVAKRLHVLTCDHEALQTRLGDLSDLHESLTTEHETLNAHRETLVDRCAALTEERDELLRRRTTNADSGEAPPLDSEVVWALTLARIDRMWHLSVAPSQDAVSPLVSSGGLLADALGVVVQAAREEAGAIVDLDFEGSTDVDAASAATVVCLVEELVASAIAVADETTIGVVVDEAAVFVAVHALTDGSPVSVGGPSALAGADGRYQVDRAAVTVKG